MITIEKNYHFYAAHRNPNLIGTKCVNLHGHSYFVTVCLEFNKDDVDDETGTTIPFEFIDGFIDPIILDYDHSTLVSNDDADFVQCVREFPQIFGKIVYFEKGTSVENLCKELLTAISDTPLGAVIKSVMVKETVSSSVTYYK